MEGGNFIDYVKIFCKTGNGGKGSTHMRREKYAPKGGPDGGDGGRGGNIYLKGNSNYWTLMHLKYKRHVRAGHGGDGSGSLKSGSDGDDIILEVPFGTIAKDAETGEQMAEILSEDDKFLLLSGGRGGRGNNHFKSSVNQTPRYAQPGEEGVEHDIILELKVLADVGLVGFPNSGKSTLLSTITAAKPKIASYPFTTMVPNLGIVSYREDRSFVMADIPGIIENAHQGKGLGHRFLRHIERNAVLLFMVPADTDDIKKEFDILLNECSQYNSELLHKDKLLAITKSDLIDEELKEMLSENLPVDVPIIFISSITQSGLVELKDMIWEVLNRELV